MLSAAPLVAILVALSLGGAAAAAAAATPLAPARSARSSQPRPSRSAVAADEQRRCHRPTNRRTHRDCAAYATPIANASAYGSLPAACFDVTWRAANRGAAKAAPPLPDGGIAVCVRQRPVVARERALFREGARGGGGALEFECTSVVPPSRVAGAAPSQLLARPVWSRRLALAHSSQATGRAAHGARGGRAAVRCTRPAHGELSF